MSRTYSDTPEPRYVEKALVAESVENFPTGTINITENGSYNVVQDAMAVVNVPTVNQFPVHINVVNEYSDDNLVLSVTGLESMLIKYNNEYVAAPEAYMPDDLYLNNADLIALTVINETGYLGLASFYLNDLDDEEANLSDALITMESSEQDCTHFDYDPNNDNRRGEFSVFGSPTSSLITITFTILKK